MIAPWLLLVCICLLFLCAFIYNPLLPLTREFFLSTRVQIYPSLRIIESGTERLVVLEPEKIFLYNSADGILFYYLGGGGVAQTLCPYNEHPVVRIGLNDIYLINDYGTFHVTCTSIDPLSVYNHFDQSNHASISMPLDRLDYSILDVINYAIRAGLIVVK